MDETPLWQPVYPGESTSGGEVYVLVSARDDNAARLGLYIGRIHKVWRMPLRWLTREADSDNLWKLFYATEVEPLYKQGLTCVEARAYVREPDSFLRTDSQEWKPKEQNVE